MRQALFCALIVLGGCNAGMKVPDPPVCEMIIPKSDLQWQREMRNGFIAGAEEFGLEVIIKEYVESSAEAILRVSEEMPDSKDTPICIVFKSPEPIAKVIDALLDKGIYTLTVGEDDSAAPRVGHSGNSTRRLAYLWKIRAYQFDPKPKRVLLLVGDVPVKRDRLTGLIYERSDDWKAFKLRERSVYEVVAEDFEWADLVTPVGEDAARLCVENGVERMLPLDGSDFTLSLIQEGRVPIAIAPNYFQLGFRAARLAREWHIKGGLSRPIVLMRCVEVDADTIEDFKKKRYKLPPVARKVSSEGNGEAK